VPGLPQDSDDIYKVHLINNILGGGLSSRLFQEIREERGLAYSVYSYHSAFRDCGLFTVYAGTSPDNAEEVTELVMQELNKIVKEGIPEKELKRTKDQIKGNIYLGLENVSSRMSRIGKSELCFNKLISPEEVIDNIVKVNTSQIIEMANNLFKPSKLAITTIGPSCNDDILGELVKKYEA
ncbi:MAG: pitrilysin family protein, partial [Bacillota bacterium]|nr:pitrilysin family protein [Bacillota bacterium]